MTRIVALTGGIASGKTRVSDRFAALGVPVIDTDLIARELVEPGRPALAAIGRHFGAALIRQDGSLDRRKLRNLVFDNEEARSELEAILHPAIQKRAIEMVQQVDAPWCVLVVPLLVGSSLLDQVDRVLVVDTPVELQLERLKARDDVSQAQAEAALQSQVSRDERLAIADDVIVNDRTLEELEAATDAQYQRYQSIFAAS